jgi:hypothetical protein
MLLVKEMKEFLEGVITTILKYQHIFFEVNHQTDFPSYDW